MDEKEATKKAKTRMIGTIISIIGFSLFLFGLIFGPILFIFFNFFWTMIICPIIGMPLIVAGIIITSIGSKKKSTKDNNQTIECNNVDNISSPVVIVNEEENK